MRPILAANCFACHGPDEGDRQGGLRLDGRDSAIEKQAIVPGKPDESELLRRVLSDDEFTVMPPADSGKSLTAAQKETLRRWIAAGAEYETHWSFAPLRRAALPAVENDARLRNEIDRFVLARLEARGLSLSPEADRHALARRLSLDLIGLPPTPEQADAFANDSSLDAYEKFVDELLASPRFGEHWARSWLDLARYADSKGYEKDRPRTMWRYRDWVIDAFNADMPFDRFTIEQLAGDLLPEATVEQQLATAFHRQTMSNDEGGTDDEEFRVLAVKDRVDTTMQVWMGLTMGCAKCHSHKYDPISHEEYYAFYALFDQSEDADRSDDRPKLATPTATQRERLDELTRELRELRAEAEADAADGIGEDPPPGANAEDRIATLEKEEKALRAATPQTLVMVELPRDKRRTTRIHNRGNFLDPGEPVEPAVPAAFGSLPDDVPADRLAVARWLVSADNHLTPRVAVNRVWGRLFGIGLVETEEDFGSQGTPPSHPELLDWLAAEFRDAHAWSHKKLLKTIVTSATYRQSSRVDPRAKKIDVRNRLLAYAPRFRLSAEAIRDQALASAGLLSEKTHGPSVMPPQPEGIWRAVYSGEKWRTSPGEDRHRRGLYTYWRRTSPYPSMIAFDAGSREVCLLRRVRTNTPLQALVTLNDPVYIEAAATLARRMVSEADDAESRAVRGFRLTVVRPPDEVEAARLVDLYETALAKYRDDPAAAKEIVSHSEGPLPKGVSIEELATWTAVANVLLNLDEALMRN
ncbi:MAG: PSD1 and planctomycete cytochrome C domain-containing protein [Planctomycetaceae bacterium]